MIRLLGVPLLFAAGLLAAEPRVTEAKVWSEIRQGTPWTVLSGAVEASSDLPPEAIGRVVTSWPDYPRLFPKIRSVSVGGTPERVTLTEDTEVDVLGFAVRNRFTILISDSTDPTTGRRTIAWTQGSTDGKMDDLSGRWELTPQAGGTVVRYWTKSAVVQAVPGQAGIVGLFFSGELKQIINAVLKEARQRKEKP